MFSPKMNVLKMVDEKFRFHHNMLYQFWEGVSAGTATKKFQKVYYDWGSSDDQNVAWQVILI